MCSYVVFEGREIWRLPDLVALVGCDAVVVDAENFPDGFGDPVDDCCLCPVDLAATAVRAGLREVEHDGDPSEHRWERADG